MNTALLISLRRFFSLLGNVVATVGLAAESIRDGQMAGYLLAPNEKVPHDSCSSLKDGCDRRSASVEAKPQAREQSRIALVQDS